MEEKRYTPRPKNKTAPICAITFAVVGLVLFLVLPRFITRYAAPAQLAAVMLLVIGIFIAMKYCFVSNTYVLMEGENGRPWFLVEQKQGKRISTVCQLPVSRLLAIEEYHRGEAVPKTAGQTFSYIATMNGPEYQFLRARGEKGELLIKIEADADFLAALRAVWDAFTAARDAARAAAAAAQEEEPAPEEVPATEEVPAPEGIPAPADPAAPEENSDPA